MSKTSDQLIIDFNFTLADLLRTVTKRKLEQKDEIKSFKKMFEMQKQSESNARQAKSNPPAELVNAMLEEAKGLGSKQVKSDGTMTFDFFLETSKIIYRYTHQMTKAGLEESVTKRRELLREEKKEEFAQLVLETTNWETECRTNISNRLY